MSIPNQPLGQSPAVRGAGLDGATQSQGLDASKASPGSGPAFQVLLERLQKKAETLEATSKVLDDPSALAGAVDIARTSLDDALSLSDRLLEAYREAQTQSPASAPSTSSQSPENHS